MQDSDSVGSYRGRQYFSLLDEIRRGGGFFVVRAETKFVIVVAPKKKKGGGVFVRKKKAPFFFLWDEKTWLGGFFFLYKKRGSCIFSGVAVHSRPWVFEESLPPKKKGVFLSFCAAMFSPTEIFGAPIYHKKDLLPKKHDPCLVVPPLLAKKLCVFPPRSKTPPRGGFIWRLLTPIGPWDVHNPNFPQFFRIWVGAL